MGQRSFFWNGVSVGDANTWVVPTADGVGYHMSSPDVVSPWNDIVMRAILNGTGNRGVLLGWLNDLEVTGAVTPVQVDTGGAVLYGLGFENDAAVDVDVPTPAANTRYDRIVVRRDWSTRQARITRIAGTEGGGIPSITQSPAPSGTGRYDIPLATLEVTIAGAITITDDREYCTFSTVPGDGTITTAHLVAEGADLAARTTRTGSFFIGAQDFEPFDVVYDSTFSYGPGIGQDLKPVWEMDWTGALPPGLNGHANTNSSAASAVFRLPDNFAGNALTAYMWHTPLQASCTYYWRTAYQLWAANGLVGYYGTYYSTYFTGTKVVNQSYRELAASPTSLLAGDLVYYYVEEYNSSGTDRGRLLGVEFQYTGYAP